MGFFVPDPDPRVGYFGSADLSGLNDPELLGPMPFGIPLAVLRSAFGTQEEAPSLRDGDSYEIAGGPPCDGPDCQFGGNYGTNGIYGMRGKNFCFDCAVKERGMEGRSAAEKAEDLAPFIMGGERWNGNAGGGGGVKQLPWRQRAIRKLY